MTEIVIVDSGVANLASVTSAFRRLGYGARISTSPEEIHTAPWVVLPGVGAFGAGMRALRAHGLDVALRERVREDRPFLAVCLGLQLLTDASDEDPGIAGLGIVPGTCRRLPPSVRVPHLGWNRVEPDGRCRLVASGDAAFANSYCLEQPPRGWHHASSTHGISFVAALERGAVLACQFHPELSGTWGLALLERWVRGTTLQASGPPVNGNRGLIRRLIPCLDVRDGRVVKGVQFQELRDAGDPAERAALYERQGADEIVMLDVAASPHARDTQTETVRRVRAAITIPLTVGGGVRSVDDARRLLEAGADKVSVNTAAVRRPALLGEMAAAFGSQCTVLVIDARQRGDRWGVVVMGGRDATEFDAVQWARQGVSEGAGEILLTSWDRDGTRKGCDLALISAAARAVSVPIIASGGIGSHDDAAAAIEAGAEAVLAASIFHDDDASVMDVKASLAARGVRVRR